MEEKTPIELLRAAIDEQKGEKPCDTLHELHGDDVGDCGVRNCVECKIDALRKAADLVEAELGALKARALPEGCEWPRFEDGEPVGFGQTVWDTHGHGPFEVSEVNGQEDVRLSHRPMLQWCGEELTHEQPDTRARVIDGMDEETVERIDRLVKNGRWLDD